MNIKQSPVGTKWQRRANLSSYLVGCPNTLASVIAYGRLASDNGHLFRIGKHEYLSFANAEDRRRYTMYKLQRDAYRFLPLGFLADVLMVRNDQVIAAVHGDMTGDERNRAVNHLVETGGSWKVLYREAVKRYGYQVLLGGLDQMGCPWEETEQTPQLVFRIAADNINYRKDEKKSTHKIPLSKKDLR